MKMIKTVDTSGIKRVFKKHGNEIKISKAGPAIVSDETLRELFPQFASSLPIRELSNHFSSEDLYETMSQLLFTSFMLNIQSSPFASNKSYCPSNFSIDLLVAFSTSFKEIFADVVRKTRLSEFKDTLKRSIIFSPNENKHLNSFVFPSVKMVHVFTSMHMNQQLNSVKEYMFKDFPAEMCVPKNKLNHESAIHEPLMSWHFFGSYNGIQVYMRRLNINEFAVLFDFDLPFVLPIGRYTSHRMRNVFTDLLKRYSIKGM